MLSIGEHRVEDDAGAPELLGPEEGHTVTAFQIQSDHGARDEIGGSGIESGRGTEVRSHKAPGHRGQAPRRFLGKGTVVDLSHAPTQRYGLSQVVSNEFVGLAGKDVSTLVQPAGQSLMKIGPAQLGQGLVGRVAHQDVRKREPIFAGDVAALRADHFLPGQ